MPPTEFSVRPSPQYIAFYACFFPMLAALSVWVVVAEIWRSTWTGRLVGAVPFGPQIMMVILLVFCAAGLVWLFRIRPPRPMLWLEGRTLVVQGVWGPRRCELSNISSMSVRNLRISGRLSVLDIVPVHGRKIRVGLQPETGSWEDVVERLKAEIATLPV
jgi:hypothetical protein